jgi:autophagy-related protein 2
VADDHDLELRVRPLRCCATWDLVDFVRNFATAAAPSPPSPPRDAAASAAAASAASTHHAATEDKAGRGERTAGEPGGSGGGGGGSNSSAPADRCASRPSMALPSSGRCRLSAVAVKLDFDTRLIDLEHVQRGDMLELLKLFPLHGVEVQLRPAELDAPFDGFARHALASWIQDVTSSQLRQFAAGVGPLRPLSRVSGTAANVILLPLQHYRRGDKVLFGLKVGALEFARALTVESAQATVSLGRLVSRGLHYLADGAESPGHGQRRLGPANGAAGAMSHPSGGGLSGARQPAGVRAGLGLARASLTKGVQTAAHAIIAVPVGDFRRTGDAKGAAWATLRAIPIAVLAPAIGATEAISYTLLGLRNALDPDARCDEDDRYG